MEHEKEILKTIPHSPGVYIYRDSQGTVIYVGKAVDLAKRVRQYFTRDDAVGQKTEKLVSQIQTIETVQTANEFDALLLEAKLIRQYMPKYNVIAKDDKSPLYIAISLQDELPSIRLVRRPEKEANEGKKKAPVYFGPFQTTKTARSLLSSLRRIVPFCTQKQRTGRACFYTHLGLCSPCPSVIAKMPDGNEKKQMVREYRNHMFRLRDILTGKSTAVVHELEHEMQHKSEVLAFEEAAAIRNQINALYDLLSRHYDPIMYSQAESQLMNIFDQELSILRKILAAYYPAIDELHRIECIDISNTLGAEATGSVVVLIEGKVDTSQYRRFRIRSGKTPNDFAMISEVLTRRLRHEEWAHPDLLVIDGGKGQVHAATTVLTQKGLPIPVIGLAKRQEEIVVPQSGGFVVLRIPLSSPALHVLQRIRDEAHRFALSYHRLLRSRARISR